MPKVLQKFERNNSAKLPFLILAVSILLTLGITYIFYQSAKNKDSIRFNNEVSRLEQTIENKINLYVALLKGGRGFIESNRQITRANFAEYVSSLNLEKNYSGVQGIGYAEIIPATQREKLIKKMRADGFEDFEIFPAAEKDSSPVILYLEPLNEYNRQAVGFDMSSETGKREVLDRARDSGEALSSGKIILTRENEPQPGFLICLPIYKNGEVPASVKERAENLTGYIYSPFHARDFLKEVESDSAARDILLTVFDGEANENNLLARNVAAATATAQTFASPPQIEESYVAQKEIDVAGRKWVVQFNSLPAFAAQSSLGWSPLIFIVGILGSFALFGMTYWETSARIKLQSAAADLFDAEQQKQGLLEKEQAARLSAERANKTKDEFLAVVSHELRTPLNAIGGWTRILRTEDLSDNTKKLALEKIEKNLRSQTKIVEDLIEYSQIVSGSFKLDRRRVNVSEIFEQAVAEIEWSAGEKNIELVKDDRLNGQLISGDEAKLKIAVENLLNNAVKFTQTGGRIEAILSGTEDESAIKIVVRDNGRGIEPEFLPRIFDRFARADTSSTRDSGGLGLGLTISEEIIKLHRGKIEATSDGAGKGATFTVTLPVH